MESKYLTIKKAAAELGCGIRTLYNLKYKGEIDFHYLGTRVFIDMNEVHGKLALTTESKHPNKGKYQGKLVSK